MNKDSSDGLYFSIDGFRKWMSSQDDLSKFFNLGMPQNEENEYLGRKVKPKINEEKLLSKIDVQDGNIDDVIEDFTQYGGIILEVNDNKFLIEVDSGSFYLSRNFVKIKKNK